MADPRRNGSIGKAFELAELHFQRNIECNFRIREIFSDRDRNFILNACSKCTVIRQYFLISCMVSFNLFGYTICCCFAFDDV